MRAPRNYGARPSGVWAPSPQPFLHKADAGFIETEYIGEEEDSARGPTGRLYKMKPGEPVLVHPMDLNNLRARGFIP